MLAALLVCASLVLAQKPKRTKPRPKAPISSAVVATPVAPVPFRAGEILEYRVLFSKYAVTAAKIAEIRNCLWRMLKAILLGWVREATSQPGDRAATM